MTSRLRDHCRPVPIGYTDNSLECAICQYAPYWQ